MKTSSNAIFTFRLLGLKVDTERVCWDSDSVGWSVTLKNCRTKHQIFMNRIVRAPSYAKWTSLSLICIARLNTILIQPTRLPNQRRNCSTTLIVSISSDETFKNLHIHFCFFPAHSACVRTNKMQVDVLLVQIALSYEVKRNKWCFVSDLSKKPEACYALRLTGFLS